MWTRGRWSSGCRDAAAVCLCVFVFVCVCVLAVRRVHVILCVHMRVVGKMLREWPMFPPPSLF